MKTVKLTLLSSILFTNCAFAHVPIYLNVGAGGVYTSQSSSLTRNSNNVIYSPTAAGSGVFNLTNVHWKDLYNSGYDIDFAAGVMLCNFRLEGEFLYQNMNRRIKGFYNWHEVSATSGDLFARQVGIPIHHRTANMNSYSFLANAYYDFRDSSTHWVPYLGAGIGVAWLNSPGETTNGALVIHDTTSRVSTAVPTIANSPSLSGTSLAGQLKAGLAYEINKHFAVSAEYRLFVTSCIHANNSSINVNPGTPHSAIFKMSGGSITGLLNNDVNLNLRYTFT
ncbi:MAG: outer membrane protein [Gammaproteobacteria bacterium]